MTRGLAVLEAFGAHSELSQAQIAAATGLPYQTVRRILMTLLDTGLIEILPGELRYAQTTRVLTLSAGFVDRLGLVPRFRDAMDALCREVLWPVSLVAPAGNQMTVRYNTHDATPMTFKVYEPGFARPLGQSASGIAYLSALPPDRVAPLTASLELSPLEHQTMLDHIASARALGYAAYERTPFNQTPGRTSTIGVPVFHDGLAVGAVVLTWFVRAMPLAEAIALYVPRLKQLAQQPQVAL